MQIGIFKAAEIAGMSVQNLDYLIKKGKGPIFDIIAKRKVFEDSIVKKWIKDYRNNQQKGKTNDTQR